jgi:hypothetical protein
VTRPQDVELVIAGQETARFECVFPTCGGVCCKNGRPPVEAAEAQRIEANLEKVLPHLLPRAREVIETRGFLTQRVKEGLRTLAVVDGWCVFHNEGCVLHKVGASEGDRWKYKPWRCIAFPLERSKGGNWHVRQHGVHGEAWDLFCLDPKESPKPASTTLGAEVAFARELDGGTEAWRFEPVEEPAPAARPDRRSR